MKTGDGTALRGRRSLQVMSERAARGGRARSRGGAHDRVRQRLLRSAARRPRALSAGRGGAKADRLVVAVNDDAIGGGAEGSGPADPAGGRSRGARRRAARRRLRRRLRRRRPSSGCCAVKPDVHCKGTDYTVDSVPERAIVQATAAARRSSATRSIMRRAISLHRGSDRRCQ